LARWRYAADGGDDHDPTPVIAARSAPTRELDPTRAPATALTVAAALAVFVAGVAGLRPDILVVDVRAFWAEPWRLVGTTIVHSNVIHLAFNLYWLVRIGMPLEARLGTLRMVGWMLVVGAGSTTAEYALAGIGVGLSGIGYGLVAFGWVLRDDPRFGGFVDRRTAVLFGWWFLLCVALTVLDLYPIANVAHGVGAGLGATTAWIAQRQRARRRGIGALCTVVLLCLCAAGATAWRPWVNFSQKRGQDSAHLGWKLLEAQEDTAAEPFLREAVRVAPHRADHWFNLAICLHRQKRNDEALEAYRTSWQLEPDARRLDILRDMLVQQGFKAMAEGDTERGVALCQEAQRLCAHDARFEWCHPDARADVDPDDGEERE
jgi:membrane associated rhomboid family serine protease